MGLKYVYKSIFYSDFFEENAIPSVYKKLKLKGDNEEFYNPETKILPASKIYDFELVPNYLDLKIEDGVICKKVFQKLGYAINLTDYNSVEDYIKSEFKTSLRKNLNRVKNKLESCYNIKYDVFYGNITNEHYYALMDALHLMLVKRFEERNDRNLVLENWSYYVNNSLDLIKSKRASLFVISSDNVPISITLNYHHKKIIYSAIASYNLDFYKYSLGSIIIYKLTEWSFINHYKLIDLGYGNFSHKQNWCNKTYSFENNIIYSKNVWFGKFYAVGIAYKNRLINYLLLKKVNVLYKNFKQFFKGSTNEELSISFNFKITKINHLLNDDVKNLNTISFNDVNYLFLRKPVNEFIYSNNNHINNVSVFKATTEPSIFYIKGEKCSIKLTCLKD